MINSHNNISNSYGTAVKEAFHNHSCIIDNDIQNIWLAASELPSRTENFGKRALKVVQAVASLLEALITLPCVLRPSLAAKTAQYLKPASDSSVSQALLKGICSSKATLPILGIATLAAAGALAYYGFIPINGMAQAALEIVEPVPQAITNNAVDDAPSSVNPVNYIAGALILAATAIGTSMLCFKTPSTVTISPPPPPIPTNPPENKPIPISKSNSPTYAGAGVLPCCVDTYGTAHLLLSKEATGKFCDQWCDFGGSKDPGEMPAYTAAREFAEESREKKSSDYKAKYSFDPDKSETYKAIENQTPLYNGFDKAKYYTYLHRVDNFDKITERFNNRANDIKYDQEKNLTESVIAKKLFTAVALKQIALISAESKRANRTEKFTPSIANLDGRNQLTFQGKQIRKSFVQAMGYALATEKELQTLKETLGEHNLPNQEILQELSRAYEWKKANP